MVVNLSANEGYGVLFICVDDAQIVFVPGPLFPERRIGLGVKDVRKAVPVSVLDKGVPAARETIKFSVFKGLINTAVSR